MFFILRKFQVERPKNCMSNWFLMSKQWPFPLYFDICHSNADYFEWRNVYMMNLYGWNIINVYYKFHVQYLSIGSHFTHFYCIWRRFGSFSRRVEISKIFHVKMLNKEEIVSFPHYLVVHHCNANDFELG